MKTFLPHVLLVALLAATPALAAPKKKGGGGKQASGARSAAAQANSPAAALEPFVNNIDGLLALQPPSKPALEQAYHSADSRLTVLRQQFVTDGAAAPEAEKPKYRAAIATADALLAAITERRSTAANIKASRNVTGSSKLNEGPRKDNLSQGVKGQLPKAVAEVTEGRREKAAKRQAKEAAADKDQALNAMAVNRWRQRCVELRQGILASYAQAL